MPKEGMTREAAVAWLMARSWIVTEVRVMGLMVGIDLCGLGCASWSDDGPCTTCVEAAIDDVPSAHLVH